MSVKRYDFDNGPGMDNSVSERQDGDYVLASDHDAAIAERDVRIAELEAKVAWASAMQGALDESNLRLITERDALQQRLRQLEVEHEHTRYQLADGKQLVMELLKSSTYSGDTVTYVNMAVMVDGPKLSSRLARWRESTVRDYMPCQALAAQGKGE